MNNFRLIMNAILAGYPLPSRGYHGVVHWARVFQNGLRISQVNSADEEIVTLFALFHDSRRVNEHRDNGHGLRGAELARSLRGTLVHLDDTGFEMLFEACERHTDGLTSDDATIGACWDADRMDLGRVGITPDPRKLSTTAARDFVAWANERAIRDYEPRDVLSAWGVPPKTFERSSKSNKKQGTGLKMNSDPYDLRRFVEAQASSYDAALSELRAGKKSSHWMWYIFPQYDGLGSSETSRRFSIKSDAEARAYLDHPVLGPRLSQCSKVVLDITGRCARDIFGSPDDMKLHSSATLFAQVSDASIFQEILDKYFGGKPAEKTLSLLDASGAH